MKINKRWHEKNRMPKNATFEQKLKWHMDHSRNCSCRPGFPEKLEEEMKKRGIKVKKLKFQPFPSYLLTNSGRTKTRE